MFVPGFREKHVIRSVPSVRTQHTLLRKADDAKQLMRLNMLAVTLALNPSGTVIRSVGQSCV